MKKNFFIVCMCIVSSMAGASVISVNMSDSVVVADTGSPWSGGATFFAGESAVNASGSTFNNEQVAYLNFSVSSAISSIASEAAGNDWYIKNVTLSLAETWYPHNTKFYLGAGLFDISMVLNSDWSFDPSESTDVTIESLGEFYHDWEATDQAWSTSLYVPTSSYELDLTNMLLSTLSNSSDITLFLSAIDSTTGLAFFNNNWGGGPILQIEYDIVPEPASILCLLAGSVLLKRRKLG
jgi:hypothetical protein